MIKSFSPVNLTSFRVEIIFFATFSPIPEIADNPNKILSPSIEKFISDLFMFGGNTSIPNCFASKIYLLIIPALSLFRLKSALKKYVG